MDHNEVIRSRTDGLLVESIDGDLVIYDTVPEAAHVLSPLAASIWRAADSGATVASLMSELRPAGGAAELELAIFDLRSANLLDEGIGAIERSGMTRRSLLKKIGITAVAAPFVMTILTENPAAAAVGAPCSASATCAPVTETCVQVGTQQQCGRVCAQTGGDATCAVNPLSTPCICASAGGTRVCRTTNSTNSAVC